MATNPFDDPRLDQYRVNDNNNEEDDEFGVYLKFHCMGDKETKTCFAFWSNDPNMIFQDVSNNNSPQSEEGRLPIIKPTSKILFNLIPKLLRYHGYVNISVDDNNLKMFPEDFKALEKVLSDTYGGNDNIYLDFPSGVKPTVAQKKPTAMVAPPTFSKMDISDMQRQILGAIKSNELVYMKYLKSNNALRLRAQEIGVESLRKGMTLDDSLQEVEDTLDGFIKE